MAGTPSRHARLAVLAAAVVFWWGGALLAQETAVVRVKLIQGEVRALLDGFGSYERPRRIALLPRLLTEEEGELTPSLKVKLRVVKEKWAGRVAHLFDEDGKD